MKYEIRKFDCKFDDCFIFWCTPERKKYFSDGIVIERYDDRKEMIRTAKELADDPANKNSVICYGYTDESGQYHDENAFFCK